MNSPTDMLEQEHRSIAKVVAVTSELADRIEAKQPIDREILRNIVEFMRVFADRCHHGKEEDLLFPLLVANGVPVRGCPIGALTAEHVKGRSLVQGLAKATEALAANSDSGRSDLVSNLRGIADLYPGHIWKEDYLLFPMTNKILRAEQLEALYRGFLQVDQKIGKSVYQRLEQFAETMVQ
ncbi:MAG TPA: hemerythrin domain-containing protein [bacterium]|nr:hemerythrin domain-containing protein [bacterium]HPG45486.1 hemerythrin domain-containing protein [bacterium]HPM96738.1 hemerythrin domain-containing protein [bacterium]